MSIVNETFAAQAVFLAAARRAVAGETANRTGLIPAGSLDRRLLAWTALTMLAEQHDGLVDMEDVLTASAIFARSPRGWERIARDLVEALNACQ